METTPSGSAGLTPGISVGGAAYFRLGPAVSRRVALERAATANVPSAGRRERG
jgi:hypothetical protein